MHVVYVYTSGSTPTEDKDYTAGPPWGLGVVHSVLLVKCGGEKRTKNGSSHISLHVRDPTPSACPADTIRIGTGFLADDLTVHYPRNRVFSEPNAQCRDVVCAECALCSILDTP